MSINSIPSLASCRLFRGSSVFRAEQFVDGLTGLRSGTILNWERVAE